MAKLRADIISSAAKSSTVKSAAQNEMPKLLPKGLVVVLESIGSTSVLWALELLYCQIKTEY